MKLLLTLLTLAALSTSISADIIRGDISNEARAAKMEKMLKEAELNNKKSIATLDEAKSTMAETKRMLENNSADCNRPEKTIISDFAGGKMVKMGKDMRNPDGSLNADAVGALIEKLTKESNNANK